MPVTEESAVAAARAYAAGRGYPAWRDGSVATRRETVRGHDCWVVTARDVPAPGEPDWFDVFDAGQSYLVDVASGECIGAGKTNGWTLFVPAKG